MYRYTTDPSVITPHSTYQNANPLANFQQMTYNQPQTAQMGNFNQAFQSNKPMIEAHNFTNRNNVYHNNLNQTLLAEGVTEYTLDIDSYDRDITVYPNPFKYNVIFAPVVNSGVSRREEWIDESNKSLGKKIVEDRFNGPPQPYINKQFRNVKYIRLETVALPKYGAIKDGGSGTWIMDTSVSLCDFRHVLLRFKNVETHYNLSTNLLTDSVGIKLVPNTISSGNFYYAECSNSSNLVKTYQDSKLGNLDRLCVEFYDDMGNQMSYSNLDSTQAISDVRNPKNRNLQNNLTIVLGVVENELSTQVKYDN